MVQTKSCSFSVSHPYSYKSLRLALTTLIYQLDTHNTNSGGIYFCNTLNLGKILFSRVNLKTEAAL